MRGALLVPAVLVAAAVPPIALAQDPDTLTPDGPATLYSDWHGAHTLEGLPPAVLTGFKVTVAPGGRAGTVRLRVHSTDGTVREAAPVTLPAEPGTYTFPAPHIAYDYRDVTLGLDQQTGGHAIAAQIRCDAGEADICDVQSVDVYRPVLGDGVKPDRKQAEVQRGQVLTLDAVSEPDLDRDLAGDTTEDRTNLRTTMQVERIAGHRLRVTVTVVNAGPRAADRPRLTLRAGTVRLRLTTPKRTWLERAVRFNRQGVRNVTLRLPRAQRLKLLSQSGDATLTARTRSATASVRVHPAY